LLQSLESNTIELIAFEDDILVRFRLETHAVCLAETRDGEIKSFVVSDSRGYEADV
jgi:hypothetical protein